MAANPSIPARFGFALIASVAITAIGLSAPAMAQRLRSSDEVEQLVGVDVVEHLGDSLPLDITFTNAEGELQPLSRYISGSRPTILVMVYFDCPMICPVVLDKFAQAINDFDYVVGRDFNVLVVSFDPTDTTTHAFDRKMIYLAGYPHGQSPEVASGWQFMTGEQSQIDRLTAALGLNIKLLSNGEYSHPVALSVISPEGMIARYIYGLDYDPKQIKFSLLEASDGKIAKSLGDQFLFRCFRYNYTEGKYSMSAMIVMRISGVLMVIILVLLIGGYLVKDRITNRAARNNDMDNNQQSNRHNGFNREATTGGSV